MSDKETEIAEVTDVTEVDIDETETADVEPSVPAVPKAPKTYTVRRSLCWAVAVVIIALSAAAGTAWALVYSQHQRDAEAAEALTAARSYAVILTTTDLTTIDKNFADVLGGATGTFKDTYAKAAATMRKMLIDNKVTTTGTVDDAAVKAVRGDDVDVLLTVKQDVTSAAVKDKKTDYVSVSMTMRKVGDRWLAADVMLAGAGGKRGN
ncbi:Mce protein [Mycobacterium sp. HM-7]